MACFLLQLYSSFLVVRAHRLREDRASSVTFAAAFSAMLTAVPGPWYALSKYFVGAVVATNNKAYKGFALALPAIKTDVTTFLKLLKGINPWASRMPKVDRLPLDLGII